VCDDPKGARLVRISYAHADDARSQRQRSAAAAAASATAAAASASAAAAATSIRRSLHENGDWRHGLPATSHSPFECEMVILIAATT
jgi:hypothetical protein